MNSVIVVGGGIIGLLSAYELNKCGLQVTLIDRQQFGQESSWAGGGIISPLFPWRYPDPISALAKVSQQLYPEIIKHMQQATGVDPEYLPSGMLILGDYSDENPQQWSQRLNIDMQAVDQKQIQQLAPEASDHFDQGWWLPHIHQARNPRLVTMINAYLYSTKTTLINNQNVIQITSENGIVSGVKTDTTIHHADAVVIAGGAWTSKILNQQPVDNQIKPIKGQMLLLKGPPGRVRHITLSEDRYIIPRKDGRVLVGSTTEDKGFDKSTSESVRQQLLDYAKRTIPVLEHFTIEHHWSGLRPCSRNGLPMIGEHPSIKQLYINSGHYRNGVVMAPASAQLLSQLVTRTDTSLNTQDYAPCDPHHTKNKGMDRSSVQI